MGYVLNGIIYNTLDKISIKQTGHPIVKGRPTKCQSPPAESGQLERSRLLMGYTEPISLHGLVSPALPPAAGSLAVSSVTLAGQGLPAPHTTRGKHLGKLRWKSLLFKRQLEDWL